MKGILYLIAKTIVMVVSIFLITFIPTTENEFEIFCASRLALILLVCIDYIGVILNNTGVEQLIGGIGVVVTFILIGLEVSIFGNLLIPIENYTYITGNNDNYLTQFIPEFKIQTYLLVVFGSIVALLGFETVNYGGKTIYSNIKEKSKSKSKSKFPEEGIGEDNAER